MLPWPKNSNLLDLILTNNSFIVNAILIEDPVGKVIMQLLLLIWMRMFMKMYI